MKTNAVIFDMDGVLINSLSYNLHSYSEVLGVEIKNEDVEPGFSLRDMYAKWQKKYGSTMTYEDFEPACGEVQRRLIIENEKADPNLIKFLEDLVVNGIPRGVGTSSVGWRANEFLSFMGLRDYFPVIVSLDDVKIGKPDPAIFLETARRLCSLPEQCVVIEDAVSGIQAAKAGEMKAVGYTRFSNDNLRCALEEAGADLVIDDFSELSYEKVRGLFSPCQE